MRTGPSIIDQGAGMWAVIGILARCCVARKPARAARSTLRCSRRLCPGCMATAAYLASGNAGPKRVYSENGGMAPHKAYQASDGWVVIAAANDNCSGGSRRRA